MIRNMVVLTSLSSLMVIALAGCPHWATRTQVPQGISQASGNQTVDPTSESENPWSRLSYEPLTADKLADIEDITWHFNFRTYDDSTPPEAMWAMFRTPYFKGFRETQGAESTGFDILPGTHEYEWEFADEEPFLDLLEYVRTHPDVLLDGSEWTGPDPHWWHLPDGVDEFFVLSINVPNDTNLYGCAKGIVPGEAVDEDIQYVMDQLALFRDELLLHPIVTPLR